MGEVYRARDTKLNRDVAVKVLLPAVANDPDRLARFSREAQLLASLNHPNIAQIYRIEDAEGVKALVLELVEGEDLAQRISRGPISRDEALPIARQIAEALEAAHEQGIIHRDLKPANIKVRPDGTVKVLDFGLAKAMEPVGASSANAMNSPTLSIHATQAGIILGTAAYMSPEQARGKAVDRRADIWAFGVVLFEMLTGQRAFAGDTVTDVVAAVVTRDPTWTLLPADTPVAIGTLVRRCLMKAPEKRLPHIGIARLEIDEAMESPATAVGTTAPAIVKRRAAERVAWLAAVCGIGIAAAIATTKFAAPRSDAPLMRFALPAPTNTAEAWVGGGISPDGRQVVFSATPIAGASNELRVRALDSSEARMLAGTGGAASPFWSADSRSVGFFAQGKLKRMDVTGAPPITICDAPNAAGATWNRDGVILFAAAGGLWRVPASGGQSSAVTHIDRARGETSHRSPSFLPDGSHFLYSAQPQNAIYVGSLQGGEPVRVVDADSSAVYAEPGFLLFVKGKTLVAQAFDAARGRIDGDPRPIAERVDGGRGAFSVSKTGVLIYRTASVVATQLSWFDRSGKPLGPMGDTAQHREFVLSADDRQVADERVDPQLGTRAIWQIDVARGVSTRVTDGSGSEDNMAWSPDARQLVFTADGKDGPGLYQRSLSGGDVTTLLKSAERTWPEDWSSDGRYIVYLPADHHHLGILPLFGDRKPFTFLELPSLTDEPQFSPDVHWMAYMSDESGRFEVYVQRFPERGDKVRVSTDGGSQPKWRRDGRELFYLRLDGTLMAVEMRGGTPTAVPRELLQTRINVQPLIHQYAVTRDGQRFLMITPVGNVDPTPFTVLVNWLAVLQK